MRAVRLRGAARREYEHKISRLQSAVVDARRYDRLRILGCAPGTSPTLKEGTVLRFQNLDGFIDSDIKLNPSRGEAANLDKFQPSAVKKKNLICLVGDCGRGAGLSQVMCDHHWSMVPQKIKIDIRDVYIDVTAWENLAPGKVPPKFQKLLGKAMTYIIEE